MKKLLIVVMFLYAGMAYAQQDAMISQYMFNGMFINPAYTGSHKYFNATLLHRSQWVGIDGAPKTSVFAVHGPIKSEKMGLGLIVSQDQIGVTKQRDVLANYAYHVKLGPGKLALGLKGGFSSYSANLADLVYWDKQDQIYSNGARNITIPKFGFGAYYYSDKWYAGFSIPTLLAYSKGYNFSLDVQKSSFMRRHYFLTGGYVINLGEVWKVKPSVLFKYVKTAPAEVDLNGTVFWKDMISFGLSYRSGDAMVAILEYQASAQFRIGYAYDYTLSKLNSYTSGSHEIMISYDFGKDVIAVKTPRYF